MSHDPALEAIRRREDAARASATEEPRRRDRIRGRIQDLVPSAVAAWATQGFPRAIAARMQGEAASDVGVVIVSQWSVAKVGGPGNGEWDHSLGVALAASGALYGVALGTAYHPKERSVRSDDPEVFLQELDTDKLLDTLRGLQRLVDGPFQSG